MAAYVDFTYYSTTFLGTAIASADFGRLALRATAEIDRMTFARAAAVVTAATDTVTVDQIKMATCAVAEEIQKNELAGGTDNITSERVGNYSVSYGNKASANLSAEEKYARAARVYMWQNGLMFKGLQEGERAHEHRYGQNWDGWW